MTRPCVAASFGLSLLASAAIVLLAWTGEAAASAIARQTRALPEIPAPLGGEASWIAPAMRLNGVPMTIKRFSSRANADAVLHHYEQQLRTSASMKTRRTREGEWQVLAIMANAYYATIRAHDTAQGAQGTITVTPALAHLKPRKHTNFPHPPTARIISLQEYDDAGIEAQHISLVSRRSVAIEARDFEQRLERAGWQVQRSEAARTTHQAHVLEAQKGAALAFINLHRAARGGATTITIVWRKA